MTSMNGTLARAALAAQILLMHAMTVDAQWSTVHEQFYLQAPHNWTFRDRYAGADRLFNAFDYGHAILYETLWAKPNAPASQLEEKEYDFLTKRVLVKPPRLPVEEGAIEVRYAQLAPEAKVMFEWAHILHRQLYDVLADERLDAAARDAEVARLIAYYRSRPDVAFSTKPKSMKLMQEQPYSLAFRLEYPKFNGLIWAYHWLQVGLYEPLVVGQSEEERQKGVGQTVARFWQMLGDPPRTFPHQMPMTAAVSPTFAARYPEAAIIFDNLHSMHDVISDILANDRVPRRQKRAEILRAAELFRDDSSYVMAVDAWLAMAGHMGVENMGGPSVGFLPELPTPTVTYGAVMTHDDRTGAMTGFKHGSATGGEHARHALTPAPAAPAPAADPHAGHVMAADTIGTQQRDSSAVVQAVAAFHAALESGDSLAALALLAPDARILESGGTETVAEYRAHHLPADIAFARAVRSVRETLQVTVSGDMAWVASRSTAEGTMNGRAVNSAGAELVVLTRAPDRWRIAAIHWSSRRRSP
jgi:ketosteroid isomerase-like protein